MSENPHSTDSIQSSHAPARRRFRWRIFAAALNWSFGGIFLVCIPLILLLSWQNLTFLPDSKENPSVAFLAIAAIAAILMLYAGCIWKQGKWTLAILGDVIACLLLLAVDGFQESAVTQRTNPISTNDQNHAAQNAVTQRRRTYEEPSRVPIKKGDIDGNIPPIPDRPPRHDDEAFALSFFRTLVKGRDMANMQIPRTYSGRSEFRSISFRNSNLSESTMCWNDFNDVDFTNANLSKCNLRASLFNHVNFENADLSHADLRRSSFEKCNFHNSTMIGTKMTHPQARIFSFTAKQNEEVDWQETDGGEPEGG